MSGASPNSQSGDPTLEAIGECVERLNHTVAQARLYGAEHPETRRAFDGFYRLVTEVMQWLGPLDLVTTYDGMRWKNQVVSTERDDRLGVARHLHVEGIANLTFNPGLTPHETLRLTEVLRLNLSLPEYEEETLESLMWQEDFPNITFRAVSELMEAEALSGRSEEQREERRLDEHILREILESVDSENEQRNIADQLRNAGFRRFARREADVWTDQSPVVDDDDEEWMIRFSELAEEDAEALRVLRDELDVERPSQLVARLAVLLLRVAIWRRNDVKMHEAMRLAGGAIRQIYGDGDPVGLLQVLEEGHGLAEQLRGVDEPAREQLRKYLRSNVAPLRVARMLRTLDVGVSIEKRTLARFLRLLPDEAVLALLEGTTRDVEDDTADLQPFMDTVYRVVGARVLRTLEQADRVPVGYVTPAIHLLRFRPVDEVAPYRLGLLRHPASQVREAALSLFENDLPRDAVDTVTNLVFDRVRGVRRGAARVLNKHRPPEAVALLRRRLKDERFHAAERPVKIDACETYARIGAMGAIQVLENLLNSRPGLIKDDQIVATIEAAAMGMAASGNPTAIKILERGARAWSAARRAACEEALASIGGS